MTTKAPPFPVARYLAPQYWPTWIGLGLVRAAARLPYGWQLGIGRAIGTLTYHLLPRRRHIARTNLGLAFPELSNGDRETLVRRSFQSAGIALLEAGLSWWGTEEQLAGRCRLEGMEHLTAAMDQGRGVLLLGGHYTTLEISGRLLSTYLPALQPIYKKARNPLFDAVMVSARRRLFDDLLENRDLRTIVRSLKSNKVCWYAPDQDFGRKQSVFAPFMGIATATLVATSRLARLSGAPVVPFYSERLEGGQGYVLRFGPALKDFPSGDDVRDATAVNQAIEAQVRRTPEQYLWVHRRFKTRPPGEPSLYGKGQPTPSGQHG